MDQADNLRKLVKLKNFKENLNATDEGEKDTVNNNVARIIAITSGKGGVGKTSLTLNLALSLAKNGKKVLILDADFGTANIDIALGILPKYNISHVIYENKSIEEVVIDGPYGIKILPGVSGVSDLTTLNEEQREYLFDHLEVYQNKFNPDFVLIDTGAGIGNNVISFLLAADEVMLVVTPDPTAMSDAYAIVKSVHRFNTEIKFNVIVNMSDSVAKAKNIFNTIKTVSERFLSKELFYAGSVVYNKNVVTSVRQQKPLVLSYPNSDASLQILRLSKGLISSTGQNSKSMKSFFELATKYFGWNND